MGEECEISATKCNGEEVEFMDTPEKSKSTQIATSISKFEESPVFNFLNNLSPIKPAKSIHISQTINPLSFASIPSVFTSPHVSSLRESRFLPRHQFSDPSKPEFSSDDGNPVDSSNANTDAYKKLEEQHECLDLLASQAQDEVAGRPSHGCSDNENSNYDDNNPNFPSIRVCDLKVKHIEQYANASSELVYGSEVNLENNNEIDQNREATSCDWESLIADASDMIVFESPNDKGSYKESVDPGTHFYTGIKDDTQQTLSLGSMYCGEQVGDGSQPENLCIQPGEGTEMMEDVETHNACPSSLVDNPSEEMDSVHFSGIVRGMRRRCLDFEMSASPRKQFDENLAPDSSVLLLSDCSSSPNNSQLVPTKPINESQGCVLPSIGLHLNALGTSSKDYKLVNLEASASGRLLIGPSSSVNFHPPSTHQEVSNSNLAVTSLGGDIDTVEDCVPPPVKDDFQASECMTSEEIIQNSPKKKSRRLEQAGEGESCKRCNCKKSKCLKLYCECFAAGLYCVEPCACIDCFNKPVHEDTVLATRKQIESRNPLAFAPKVIRGSDYLIETRDDSSNTPASARHKRGCNCKKSGCLKKYCECYQGGVGCSINCRCEGCKNAFGRKDGMEAEYEDDGTDTTENSVPPDRLVHNPSLQNCQDQKMESAAPATPLLAGRQSVQHLLNTKRSRSSLPSMASSSRSYGSQVFRKPSFQHPPKIDEELETIEGNEMPEFLQQMSPVSGIKSSSPNRKRVSPPSNIKVPTGLRSSRKLILQSIPSFPSLNSNP